VNVNVQAPILLLAVLSVLPVWGDELPHAVGTFGQEVATRHTTADGLPSNDVRALRLNDDGQITAITDHGAAAYADGRWTPTTLENPDLVLGRFTFGEDGLFDHQDGDRKQLADEAVHSVAVAQDGTIFAATDRGYLAIGPDGTADRRFPMDDAGRMWGGAGILALAIDSDGKLWTACPAGVARFDGESWVTYTGEEGLPYNAFTAAAPGPDGTVWFGTAKGAVRYEDGDFAYRQGLRWLPGDEVRDVLVADDGTAWFATDGGVGAIAFRPMTLREKADFYADQIDAYIKRTEYGYTSEVRLPAPGDTSEIIYTDSDNDGLWTAMYGASMAYAYGATRDPKAKERAQDAFEALRFLQTVTQGGEHSPPKGYVARTILPGDGPDPNDGRIERDERRRAEQDYLWKVYEHRWPLSADGKWYWKSDTSSDELDGHYYFYPLYYDLVADTEAEKERVREVVRDLTDHLLAHNYALMDHDGTVTRWAVYGPELLNFDRDWWGERGLKSLSLLSYLAVAEHITGDAKYGEVARELIDRHGYQSNAMIPKVQYGVGSGNQSDDEMAVMCFYNLLKYTQDEDLAHDIRYSFYTNWMIVQPERNPFFNFAYAVFGREADIRNPWGVWDISIWDDWLEDSVQTLKDFPLDRFNWRHENAHRLDIRELRRQQMDEPYIYTESGRGYRKNTGKTISVAETHFNHWNADLWRLDTGGDGRTLASGTVFLLPYYQGLYHGFIKD